MTGRRLLQLRWLTPLTSMTDYDNYSEATFIWTIPIDGRKMGDVLMEIAERVEDEGLGLISIYNLGDIVQAVLCVDLVPAWQVRR